MRRRVSGCRRPSASRRLRIPVSSSLPAAGTARTAPTSSGKIAHAPGALPLADDDVLIERVRARGPWLVRSDGELFVLDEDLAGTLCTWPACSRRIRLARRGYAHPRERDRRRKSGSAHVHGALLSRPSAESTGAPSS